MAFSVAHVRMDMYLGFMNTSKVEADNSADVEIANRIMQAMIVKGISLKTLSAETGISYTTLRRSLHQSREDRRSFNFQQFYRIAAVLALKPSVLLPEAVAA